MRSASGGLRMREEENESEEGAVEDDYGSDEIGGFGEIGGFDKISDEIRGFGKIGKREELRCREKRTNSYERKERRERERERVGVNI